MIETASFKFNFRGIIILTFILGSSVKTFAQEQFSLIVEWQAPKRLTHNGEIVFAPSIADQHLDNGKPVFHWRREIKSSSYELTLESFESVLAPEEDLVYLNRFGFDVDNDLHYEVKVTNAAYEPSAILHVFPYLRVNGSVHRLTNVQLELSPIPLKPVLKSFVSNSVLQDGSGTWYKIAVKKDGIYKLDKSFLESCGINTTGLNPSAINIFGNGDGKLPEKNSDPRTDDLAKNAIVIVGEDDGSFDDGDYILFYGWGPSRWRANGTTEFDQDKNIYSDISCYFININSSDIPLRVSAVSNSPLTATHIVNSYSYFDVYENDLVNLVKGGQRWYGELFDTELVKTFNFSVPDIISSVPVNFKTSVATNAAASAGTNQEYSVNGAILSTSALPAVSGDFIQSVKSMTLNSPSSVIPFKISITRNSPNTLVYLDRILLNARRSLNFYGQQFNFRDLSVVGTGNVAQYTITSFPVNGFVWDVTDRHQPKLVNGNLTGATFDFRLPSDTIQEFVASNGLNFLIPEKIGSVDPQNLHALPQADYLIVSHKNFMSQANRLADLHRAEGMTVHVVTTEQIFNEFSSGMLDPTAIRMFSKMFYDRAASNPATRPKYLLLFGDGTYDPKNRISNNNNYVPTFQFLNGENHVSAMVSDDYYGMFDPNEALYASDLLDIGVGRLLISDLTTAQEQVDKIEHYMKNGSGLYSEATTNCSLDASGQSSTFGDWRLKYVQIADDEEGGYFVTQDTEPQYNYVTVNHPEMNCDKLYTDAFTQVSTAGGERYPDVYDAITNRVERGALVVNYVGHGGEVGLAEERVVNVPQIQSWRNIDKMNVFVSATCEFTKYDDPSRVSAGEWASLNPNGGAIALMTTSRSVFFGVNTITGSKFFENVFTRDTDNEPLAFGEIMRLTKNASGSSDNKRSFTLVGDPALRIAHPKMRIVTDSINGLHPAVEEDTIRALSKVTIKGHLEDHSGNVLNSFNGIVIPSIFDKSKTLSTLGQNDDSPILPFELQRNVVYRGKASVVNGLFEFTFVVPKDISYSFGPGKISYYANDALIDASGYDRRFVIGGIDPIGITDNEGPDIELYLNDESFVSGGITDETPVIIAKLFDENGINTVGNGIGHDLTAVIDANSADPIVLNEYYTADLDSYQSGSVRYNMPVLEKGKHTLTLKVWDVNNNSSESTVEFNVQEKEEVQLAHVLNYPNPFTTKTEFFFEHNQACSELDAQVQIFTISGKLVKTINQTVHSEGFRSAGIPWDGRDDFGDQLAKGVYVYSVKVRTPEGIVAEKLEKLVLLK
ncbi:MAG: type IX secretion system sortase PorU [Flavobacteriia bacterium]